MCAGLYEEDPGPYSPSPIQVRRTLRYLREQPSRGRAVVCTFSGSVVGYALLISYWSNELGGEVCVIDEIFILASFRSRGLATELFDELAKPTRLLWPEKPVALALEVAPSNQRAEALYRRLGFEGGNLGMRRRLP
jgi:ribosomal protein S18 acetylase RimI-like enzyme